MYFVVELVPRVRVDLESYLVVVVVVVAFVIGGRERVQYSLFPIHVGVVVLDCAWRCVATSAAGGGAACGRVE